MATLRAPVLLCSALALLACKTNQTSSERAPTSRPASATAPTDRPPPSAPDHRTIRPMGNMGPAIRVPTAPADDWALSDGIRGALVTSASRGLEVEVLWGAGFWNADDDTDDDSPRRPDVALDMALATEDIDDDRARRWTQSVPGKEGPATLHFAAFEVDRSGVETRVVVKAWIFDNDNTFVWVEAPVDRWPTLRPAVEMIMGVDALEEPR